MLCGLATGASAQSLPPAPLHLVIPFENATGEPRAYWLSEGSAVLLTDDLAALGVPAIRRADRLRAFNRLRVPPVATLSHATVIRLGQVVRATDVVIGDFTLAGSDLAVHARSIRLDTGRISPEIIERGSVSELLDIYSRIARRLAAEPSTVPSQSPTYPPLAAFEQYIKGLLAEAAATQIAFLNQALKLDPTFERVRIALWDAHTGLGEHQQALAIVRQVPPGHVFSRQARFLATVSQLNLGQTQGAFDGLLALNREMADPALLNNLGIAQLRRVAGAPGPSTSLGAGPSTSLGAGGKAVSYFGEAVALDGSDPDLFFNLGYAFWLDRDTQGAIYWLREAVRRNPADDEAHYALGVALQASGSAAEASREKELARRLSSTYADWEAKQPGANAVPRGLERVKLEIDVPAALRVDAAVVAAEQRDQRAVAAFHLESGRRLFDAGRDAEAIAELRRTVFLAPYESEAHLLLGRIYLRSGRVQDAIDALTIAAWSDPGSRQAQELLESLK
jgi:Flp pilus assembly protein TadD